MKLKEIANIRTGLVLSRKKAASYAEVKMPYRQITLKAFIDSTSLNHEYFDEFLSEKEISDTYLSQVGDVVMRLREPNTAVYIDENTKGLIIPSLMSIIRLKDDMVINREFLAYYLNSKAVKKVLEKEIKGTTIPMIRTKDIEEIEVVLPPLCEQEKIVSFLHLSQKEITLLKKLKIQKERFAQGVLDTIIEENKEDKNAKN